MNMLQVIVNDFALTWDCVPFGESYGEVISILIFDIVTDALAEHLDTSPHKMLWYLFR